MTKQIQGGPMAHLAKAFTLRTEAAHYAEQVKAKKEPRMVSPTQIAIFVRTTLMLPAIPPIVVYYEHNKPVVNMFY